MRIFVCLDYIKSMASLEICRQEFYQWTKPYIHEN
jgi:hypothetical protein